MIVQFLELYIHLVVDLCFVLLLLFLVFFFVVVVIFYLFVYFFLTLLMKWTSYCPFDGLIYEGPSCRVLCVIFHWRWETLCVINHT